MVNQKNERWSSKLGVILVVASSAIGLGNFLRFPGQAATHGGGAFMVPYLISFLLLGIPVCLSEWIMGRMGGKRGHSSPEILSSFLSGVPLRVSSTIAIIIPIMVYVYYVYIEAWCLSYAIDFISMSMDLKPENSSYGSGGFIPALIHNSGQYFTKLAGTREVGESFKSSILIFTLICYIINFYLIFRGISKGLESFANKAVPILLVCSLVVLFRVLTLNDINKGLGYMWNPDWSALLDGEVWIAAAGQIFFSLSVGFGIILIFSSYLTDKDDVTLSSLSAASLNETIEVAIGGMITIPIAFIFLGATIATYETFGIGFTALPAVFALMPAGNIFGGIFFFMLFIAAITSSVSMLQPGITFLEGGFNLKRKHSVLILFLLTLSITLPLMYFNKGNFVLHYVDFWIGTFLIYILATIQVIVYGWKIGVKAGREEGAKGAIIKLPKIFDFVVKYITPTFLIIVFIVFVYQSLPEYVSRMSVDYMVQKASSLNISIEEATFRANAAKIIFGMILFYFLLIYIMVSITLKRHNIK